MIIRGMKKVIAIVLIGSFAFFVAACDKSNSSKYTDSFWYACNSFTISAVEGYNQNVYASLYYKGFYYFSVYGEKIDEKTEGTDNYCYLYKTDSKGNCISKVSLPVKCTKASFQIIVDDKLYCLDPKSNIEYIIDINKGSIISEEEQQDEIQGYYSLDNGYVKITASNIIRFSKDGKVTGNIGLQSISNISSIFQKNGRIYLMGGNIDHVIIYELSFENNLIEKMFESSISIGYEIEWVGDLFFTNEGVYSIDFDSQSFIPLTEWNYVDVKPAYKTIYAERNLSYGNGRFGKCYLYTDFEIELIIFNSIPAEVYANRTPITIGGYGVETSLAIKWAVYMFNTSQTEYRVYLDDYWNEYSYVSRDEAQSQIVKLIKYFHDGNAPDIYYGTNFDYRYMYKAGLVVDMLPIIEHDPDFSLDYLIPSIKETITKNGVCYQIFSAYYFDGDFGLQSVFGDEDYTYLEIDYMAQEMGLSVRGDMPATEFADQIIRYSLESHIEQSSGSNIISTEDMRAIVEYSIRNGMPYGADANYIANMESVHNGIDLTCRRTHLGNLYDLAYSELKLNDSFVYLGFPSINGSVHAAQPDGLVAISSDSKNQDACWDFIKYMLSDEIQEIEIGQWNNPVINRVMDDYCKYAAAPELVPETEVIWKSIVNGRESVPKWIISDYQSMVNSIDMVISYDWGLYNIISDEINSYYIQGRSIDIISETLQSRLDLYVAENYI